MTARCAPARLRRPFDLARRNLPREHARARDIFPCVNWIFPAAVRAANPGINTPGDYVRHVYLAAGLRYAAPLGASAVLLALAAWYFFVR